MTKNLVLLGMMGVGKTTIGKILSKKSGFSEIQISGEENTFNLNSVKEMISKTEKSMKNIFKIQKDAIK